MTKQEILKACTIEGNIVRLPEGQLERKLYKEVANALALIGGRWTGRKVMGFVFEEDPTELLAQIANGEKRNLKKEFQFFATSVKLADKLVQLADIKSKHDILEPEAGQAAIVKAINRVLPNKKVYCFELMPVNQTILRKIKNVILVGSDFLTQNDGVLFDRIIANPPFTNNQDIDHIYKMYDTCKNEGRIVTMASKHWQHSTNKKETQFRMWLEDVGAKIIEVDAGEFKESGTTIATVIIIINK